MIQRIGSRRKLFFVPAPSPAGRNEAPFSQVKPLFVYGTLRRGQPNHELTSRSLEAVMQYRPDHSLVLPRPIIDDPRQGIV